MDGELACTPKYPWMPQLLYVHILPTMLIRVMGKLHADQLQVSPTFAQTHMHTYTYLVWSQAGLEHQVPKHLMESGGDWKH